MSHLLFFGETSGSMFVGSTASSGIIFNSSSSDILASLLSPLVDGATYILSSTSSKEFSRAAGIGICGGFDIKLGYVVVVAR